MARFLRGLGYDVRINEGYKGVEIVRRQGRPAEGRHSLQIEVDRALYRAKACGRDRSVHVAAALAEVD